MTRKTITLPIKCSTVKTASAYLKPIILVELLLFFIIFILSASHFQISDLSTPYALAVYTVCGMVVIGWCAVIFVIWVVIIIMSYVSDHTPKLECIKEE
jgi:hypothetical protein